MSSPKRKALLVIVMLLVCASSSCLTPTTPSPEPTKEPLPRVEIPQLRSPVWEKYAGQQVTVEGIFVRDPLPMLVTDLDVVLANMPMPEDRYLLLTGPAAERISAEKWGGATLRFTGNVLPAAEALEGANFAALSAISYRFVDVKFTPYAVVRLRVEIKNVLQLANKYAVLFSGGVDASNNHGRYWNDLKFMYSTLVDTLGFAASHVTVLYGNGTQADTDMPVDHAATQANLNTVFTNLRNTTSANDTIFVFTTNHGSGFRTDDPSQIYARGGQWDVNGDEVSESLSEATYSKDLNGDGDMNDTVAWDEVLCGWGPSLLDDSLTTIMANLKYSKMVIVMEQCYSGGLIHDLRGTNRIIMSAAGEHEPSWAMPPAYSYDEFSYYFTSAINGADPDNNTVNADSNNDGKVSMVEAFNYARSHDTASETPWYEDSSDGVPHSGNMPSGGDGTLGASTFL